MIATVLLACTSLFDMLVYVVCSFVAWDSYHQVVLATLDKKEAEKKVADFNAKHEDGCTTQRPTWSDYDECFCKRLHMHELPLRGVVGKLRRLSALTEMSDLTSAAECARVEDTSTEHERENAT